MRKMKNNSSRDLISCFPTTFSQKLIDGYRVKLFAKIKDSLQKDRTALKKEELEFKEWLKDLKPFNNSSYSPYIGA